MTLYARTSLRAVLEADGNTEALRLLGERLDSCPWAVYRVRRIVWERGRADRIVERLLLGSWAGTAASRLAQGATPEGKCRGDVRTPCGRKFPSTARGKGMQCTRRGVNCIPGPPCWPVQTDTPVAKLAIPPSTAAGQQAWLKRFDEFEDQKENLELKLAEISKVFCSLRQRRHATARQVADALPQRTALVDCFEYLHGMPDREKKGRWQSARRLLAFVLVQGRDPVLVHLGAAEPIAKVYQAWRRLLTASPPTPPEQRAAEELSRRLSLPLQTSKRERAP